MYDDPADPDFYNDPVEPELTDPDAIEPKAVKPKREWQQDHKELQPPIEVPVGAISAEALNGLIEEFILREGTDYGRVEVEHEKKVAQIRKQLSRSDIKIVFDPNTESVSLLTERDWRRLTAKLEKGDD